MTTFNADTTVGGDGSNTTDDANPTTGLANGGHWTRLLPMLVQIVAIANWVKQRALDVLGYANAAAASATSALNAAGTSATSTNSMTIQYGGVAFSLVQTGKLFSVGQSITLASTASPQNWMTGYITSFNSASGATSFTATNINGSGTFASWTVSMAGPGGTTAQILNETRGADIAGASTINLDTATGNLIRITGTGANISTVTLASGRSRTVVFDSVHTLVHNASSLMLPGGRNITTAGGDVVTFRGDNVTRVDSYTRLDGRPLTTSALEFISAATVGAAVANIDFLNVFSSFYDKYVIEIEDLYSATPDVPVMRIAVGGTVDTGTSYHTPALAGLNAAGSATNWGLSNGQQIENGSSGGCLNISVEIRNANSAINKTKAVSIRGVVHTPANNMHAIMTDGAYRSGTGAAISGFRIYMAGGNTIAAGTVRVYGVRNTIN